MTKEIAKELVQQTAGQAKVDNSVKFDILLEENWQQYKYFNAD